jgi:shikimate dehydrogenase
MDRYVVIGNPISHSLSPEIHAAFASQGAEAIAYSTLLVPAGEFAAYARKFFDEGGKGANITLPFKVDAFQFAQETSPRARLAGAANFLANRGGVIAADNTDGLGLVADLTRNLGVQLRGARVLILGAGGAVRGVVAPLLEMAPARLVIANRTVAKAQELAMQFQTLGAIEAVPLAAIPAGGFDVVVNATSSSTRGEALDIPAHVIARGTLAYDMAYGPSARAFLDRAGAAGARTSDGLGMLVEQAAESFRLWHGRTPQTAPVLAALRRRFP